MHLVWACERGVKAREPLRPSMCGYSTSRMKPRLTHNGAARQCAHTYLRCRILTVRAKDGRLKPS